MVDYVSAVRYSLDEMVLQIFLLRTEISGSVNIHMSSVLRF
jgi:hypothetical protein